MVVLTTTVTRVFVDQLPCRARRVVLARADAGPNVLARYTAGSRMGMPPAGVTTVLIVRSAPLSSPDTIQVLATRRADDRIDVALEVRQYIGALLGNEVTAALIEIELGRLVAGTYTVTVVTMLRRFHRLGGEAEAVGSGRRSFRTTLRVAPPADHR